MARYIKDVTLNKPDDFVAFIMNDYLQKNSFAMSDWKGEPCYRAGDAMMEGFKYLKWNYTGGVLHLEAWLKGNFGKEMNLDGFVGCLVKKPYRESLEQLVTVLQQEIPEEQMNQQMNAEDGAQPAVQPIQVATVNNTNAATLAMLFGILALVLAFVSPIFSIICACLGFAQARMGAGSTSAGMAKAGKIMSIVGLVLAIIMWVIGIIMNVLMMM